jgi:hypothetical protein
MIGSYINLAPKDEHLADDYSQCLLSPSAPPVIDSRTYGVTTNPKSIETHRRFVLSCMGAKGCVLVPPPAKPSRCQGVKPCALALTHVPRQKYLNCEQSCTYGWRRIAFNAALRRDAPAVRPDPGPPGPGSPVRDFLSAGHPFFEDRSIASARLCSAVAARSNSGPPWRRDWRTGRTACADRTKARERYRNVCGETSCPKREGWC